MEEIVAPLSNQFSVVMSLIGILFVAVIGVYVWTFKVSRDVQKELGKIYDTVNGHLQEPKIHTSSDEMVPAKVCQVLHESLCKDVKEMKSDIKELLQRGV